jgi:hypothetical protein
VIAQVSYDDQAPWPAAADGTGYSLASIDPHGPNGDPSDPSAWRASFDPLGSPAARDTMLGDLNGNDRVGLADLVLLRNNFGMNAPTRDTGDLNSDGAITTADVAVLAKNFGRSTAPAAASTAATTPSRPTTSKLRATRGAAVDHALLAADSFPSSSLAARKLIAVRARPTRS